MGFVLLDNCDGGLHHACSGSDTTDCPPSQCHDADKTGVAFALLPVELVTQIFLEVVPDIREPPMVFNPESMSRHLFSCEPIIAPLYLSFVCKHWRSIALSLPVLWARANLSLDRVHPELLKLFLERAGPDHTQHRYFFTPRAKYAFENLHIVVSKLNMFEDLDIQLTHKPDWSEDDDESSDGSSDILAEDGDGDALMGSVVDVTDEVANQEGPNSNVDDSELGWQSDLACLPSIDSTVTALRLERLHIAISGENEEHDLHKARWCFQLINFLRGLRSLHMGLPSYPMEPGLGISEEVLRNLQHLTLKTEDGVSIHDVVGILRCTPNLVDLYIPLASFTDDRLIAPSPRRFLDLPEICTLDLSGTHNLNMIRYIYSCIRSAPKLHSLSIRSPCLWDDNVAIDLFDRLPAPVRSLDISLCDTDHWRITDYLAHRNIEPTLTNLCIDNPSLARRRLEETFFDFMTSTVVDRTSGKTRLILNELEELSFQDSLETTGNSLSKMISTRLRVLHKKPIQFAAAKGQPEEVIDETKEKDLCVCVFTSSEDLHFEDSTELEELRREYPGLFRWYFDTCGYD